jgi:hypothetical protein
MRIVIAMILVLLALSAQRTINKLSAERDEYRRQATLAVRDSLELRLQLNRAEHRNEK